MFAWRVSRTSNYQRTSDNLPKVSTGPRRRLESLDSSPFVHLTETRQVIRERWGVAGSGKLVL